MRSFFVFLTAMMVPACGMRPGFAADDTCKPPSVFVETESCGRSLVTVYTAAANVCLCNADIAFDLPDGRISKVRLEGGVTRREMISACGPADSAYGITYSVEFSCSAPATSSAAASQASPDLLAAIKALSARSPGR